MNAGYIKLHRDFKHSDLFRDAATCQFVVYCLTSASYKKRKFLFNNRVISLEAGQFVFGRKQAAQDMATTERKVRTIVKNLKNVGFLTTEATNRYTVITVVNWELYQNGVQDSDQPEDKQTTSKRPANDHIQEGKERKESKNKKTSIAPEIETFVSVFQGYVSKQHGNKAPKITPSKTRSDTDTVDKLVRLDGFEFEQVKDVLRWAIQDEFWMFQILSLSALRKKRDGQTKFQKVYLAYERDNSVPKKGSKKMSKADEAAMLAHVDNIKPL